MVPGSLGLVLGSLSLVPGYLGLVPGNLGLVLGYLGLVPGHLGLVPRSLGLDPGSLGLTPRFSLGPLVLVPRFDTRYHKWLGWLVVVGELVTSGRKISRQAYPFQFLPAAAGQVLLRHLLLLQETFTNFKDL